MGVGEEKKKREILGGPAEGSEAGGLEAGGPVEGVRRGKSKKHKSPDWIGACFFRLHCQNHCVW